MLVSRKLPLSHHPQSHFRISENNQTTKQLQSSKAVPMSACICVYRNKKVDPSSTTLIYKQLQPVHNGMPDHQTIKMLI